MSDSLIVDILFSKFCPDSKVSQIMTSRKRSLLKSQSSFIQQKSIMLINLLSKKRIIIIILTVTVKALKCHMLSIRKESGLTSLK